MHDDVSASMSDLWAFGADAAIFTQPDETPLQCQCRIYSEAIVEPDGLQRLVIGKQIRAKLLRSEISEIPQARRPNVPGAIIRMTEGPHNNNSFEVTGIENEDNHFWTCAVKQIS